jgi:arylsulfatase A-like enzyme
LVFTSDNGAPLVCTMPDARIELRDYDAGWNGSRNDPFLGEKGMLSEGAIRVPMIWHWPGRLPAGRVHQEPVSTLDIVPTALAAAGLRGDPILDGRDALPELAGKPSAERALFWRVWHQTAMRRGRWKLLRVGEREFLFDLAGKGEQANLAAEQAERLAAMNRELAAWLAALPPIQQVNPSFERDMHGKYRHHLPGFSKTETDRAMP